MKTFYTILIIFLSGICSPAKAQFFMILSSGSNQTCAPGTIQLYIQSAPPGSWTYEWHHYFGGGCITVGGPPTLAGTGSSITLNSASQSGHYVCVGYDISTGNFVQSNFLAVRIIPQFGGLLPAPLAYGFTACGNSGTLCVPNTIENDPYNSQPTVTWYKNNVLIPNATGITYQATSNGNYHYSIITPFCTNISSTTSVTVGPGSSPQITASSATTFCQGGSVQLNAATGSGFTYQWKRNTVAISGANSSSYSANLSGTYQCLVGSSSCTPGASNNISVNVNPLPVVTFTSLASSYPVTSSPVTLTGSPSGGTFSGPGVSGNTFSPSLAGAGGPYTIIYNYTDGNGCSNSASMQTTVTNCTIFPATPGSIIVSGGGVKVCQNETRTYSIAVVSGATSYTWTPPAGSTIISGQGTVSILLQFNSGFPLSDSLRVVSNNTCGSSAQRKLNIARNDPTTPSSIVITGGIANVCPGDTRSYTIPVVANATSYTWIPPTGSTILSGQGTVSISLQFNSGFPTSDTLRVVSNNNCGSSLQRKLKITRNAPVLPGTITAAAGTKACPDDLREYSILPVANATSYTWTLPVGATISSGQGTTNVIVNYNAGFVASDTLRVKTNNACGSSANRILKITRNNPATPASITGTAYNLCNQSGISYTTTNVAGILYNWSFNSALAAVASGQGTNSITANYNSGFVSASLSVNATNGCGTSANRTFTVYAKPPTPATIIGATTVCVNQQDVPYSIAPIPNISNYTWVGPTGSHISDGLITSTGTTLVTTSPSVTVDFATTAGAVKVRANNSCALGSYKSLTVSFICRNAEMNDLLSENDLQILPNPNNGNFVIQLTGLNDVNALIEISDVTGKKVMVLNPNGSSFIDVSEKLQTGIYFVSYHSDNGNIVRKFIVSL